MCLIVCRQVSAEPDGSTYVFQGFVQGKDYGQFGLQRLGMGAHLDIFCMLHCFIVKYFISPCFIDAFFDKKKLIK